MLPNNQMLIDRQLLLRQLQQQFGQVVYVEAVDLFEVGDVVRLSAQDAGELLAARCPLESLLIEERATVNFENLRSTIATRG